MGAVKEMAMELAEQNNNANEELNALYNQDRLLNLSKGEILATVAEYTTKVTDGFIEPLNALILAKKGELFFKTLGDKVRPLAEEKEYGKNYSKFNVDVKPNTTGSSWDFSVCEDVEYNKLLEDLSKAKEKVKDREAFLMALKKPLNTFDEETGETFVTQPPIRVHGKIGVSLSIK